MLVSLDYGLHGHKLFEMKFECRGRNPEVACSTGVFIGRANVVVRGREEKMGRVKGSIKSKMVATS